MTERKRYAKNMDGERITWVGLTVATVCTVIAFAGFCGIFLGRPDLMGLGLLVVYLGLRYDTFVNRFIRWRQRRRGGRNAAEQ